MHDTTPISVPDVDNGLQLVRWKLSGFDEMRRLQLLYRKSQFELIDGLVLHRDAGSLRHQRVVTELARRLDEACGPACEVLVDEELRFEDLDAVVVADIVVRGADGALRLVVEVSDDTPRVDALEKPRLYAQVGVREYWHLDLAWRFLQTYRSPYDEGWGMRASGPSYRASLTGLDELPEIVLDELLAAADAGVWQGPRRPSGDAPV